MEENIEILIEKMNKELDFLIENANKTEQLTATSIMTMKQPIILLFLSVLSNYQKVLKENEEKNKIIDLMENYMVENGWEICFDNIYAELNNCNGMKRDWSRGDELEKQDIHIFFCKKFLESEEKITYRTNQDNRYENLHTALFKNGKKEVLSESIKPGFQKIKIESDGFITKVYINNIEQKYIENLLIFQNAGEIMDIYLNTNKEVKNNEIYDN